MATVRMSPSAAVRAPQSEFSASARYEGNEARSSSVSWAAVFGGAVVTAAVSLILLVLGAGVGLSSISPWSNAGATSSTVGRAAIVWLVISQIVASAMGGYLAGRLRTKWVDVHTDEVYFRDTAHGFLSWGISLLVSIALIASASAYLSSTAAQTGAAAATSPNAYFVDSLFRSSTPGATTPITATDPTATNSSTTLAAGQSDAALHAEAAAILANGLRQQGVPAADQTYLAQMVAAKTSMSQADAEARVSTVIAEAQQAADTARKSTAHLAYWAFFALLVGAFCASFAATVGGAQRDHVRV